MSCAVITTGGPINGQIVMEAFRAQAAAPPPPKLLSQAQLLPSAPATNLNPNLSLNPNPLMGMPLSHPTMNLNPLLAQPVSLGGMPVYMNPLLQSQSQSQSQIGTTISGFPFGIQGRLSCIYTFVVVMR